MPARRSHVTRSALGLVASVALATGCVRRAPPLPAPAEPPKQKVEFEPVPDADAALVKNPHDAGGKPLCQVCHVPGASGVKKDAISLCADCHDPARMRHPFRVEAPAHASGIPLGDERAIMCHTCHDPHDVKTRRAGLRLPYAELCLKCHVRHSAKDAPGAAPTGAKPR